LAALNYEFPVSQMVCRFKFQRDLASGQILTQEMLAAISRTNPPLPDLIAPVPLHRLRQFTRSFNQAEILARGVGNHLKIPLSCGWLRRTQSTTAQSGLNADERKRNIKGAFACEPIHHQHVALVDDVLTTGTTLAECCRAVQRAGASEVSVWVAARANIG
jgi:ComF family protein